MNTEVIFRLLTNSGLHPLGVDDTYIYLEDPTCVIRSFETFVEYAWLFITILLGLMLVGWALSMIRGAKNDIFSNLKNMIMLFGVLSLAGPIINVIYGDDLFARGCRTLQVPLADVETILAARNDKLAAYNGNDLYEELEIYDSGAIYNDAQTTSSDDIPAPVKTETTDDASPAQEVIAPAPDAQNNAHPVRAMAAGNKRVLYQYANGNSKTHIDGTIAWRNTNAGNIIKSDFAMQHGAIGSAGRFAVFPTEETGINAIKSLLRSDKYINLTVAGAISRYAPPSENNTAKYHQDIERLTGISINKLVRDLNDAELGKMARAIKQIEGWRAGQITYDQGTSK